MDPYKVLNVSPSANEDEIKRAYMKLVKKYHPDRNPGNKLAEQKMKEINAAYDAIKNKSYGGAASYGNNGSGYYGYSNNRTSSESTSRFDAARNYINNRYYKEALVVLSGIRERNALWYYYSAVANYGIGKREEALSFARSAVSMEPNNPQYQFFLNQMERGAGATFYGGYQGGGYEARGGGYPTVFLNPFKFLFGILILRFFFFLLFGIF